MWYKLKRRDRHIEICLISIFLRKINCQKLFFSIFSIWIAQKRVHGNNFFINSGKWFPLLKIIFQNKNGLLPPKNNHRRSNPDARLPNLKTLCQIEDMTIGFGIGVPNVGHKHSPSGPQLPQPKSTVVDLDNLELKPLEVKLESLVAWPRVRARRSLPKAFATLLAACKVALTQI